MQPPGSYSGAKAELKLDLELPDGQSEKGNTSSYIILLGCKEDILSYSGVAEHFMTLGSERKFSHGIFHGKHKMTKCTGALSQMHCWALWSSLF